MSDEAEVERTERKVAAMDAAYLARQLQDPGQRPQLSPFDPLIIREPLTAPSPDLDLGVIEALPGYKANEGYVACVHEALTKATAAIKHVINARNTINQHSDLSAEQKVIKLAALADRHQAAVTRRCRVR